MGVKHEVLNAKNHEREAHIVAQAGRKGAVTVSTNMAGRGTDIVLGGNAEFQARDFLEKQNKNPELVPKEEWEATLARFKAETDQEHEEVVKLGGLHILGTERHESRRIDNHRPRRAARATREAPASTSRSRTICSHWGEDAEPHAPPRHGGGRADRIEDDHQAHRRGAGSRRSAALRIAQTSSRVRRRHEQAAAGRLWHAPPVARRRGAERTNLRNGARHYWRFRRCPLPKTSSNGISTDSETIS